MRPWTGHASEGVFLDNKLEQRRNLKSRLLQISSLSRLGKQCFLATTNRDCNISAHRI